MGRQHIATTRGFKESLVDPFQRGQFGVDVPRQPHSSEKQQDIEIMYPSEYQAITDSEGQRKPFLKALKIILHKIPKIEELSLLVLVQRINDIGTLQSPKIDCRVVGERLYFSYNFPNKPCGFYYLSSDYILKIAKS